MTTPVCQDVHAFADGELSDKAHVKFVEHLGGCADCGRQLEAILALGALADDVVSQGWRSSPAVAPRRWWTRPMFLTAVSVGLVSLAAGVALVRMDGLVPSGELALMQTLTTSPHRRMEAQLSYPGFEAHRPVSYMRAGSSPGEAPPLATGVETGLAELEKRGDLHGLGIVHMLLGNGERARVYLERAEQVPGVLSDRSALALSQADYQNALQLADRALAGQPGHPQALWNRALALAGLRRSAQAADTFEQAASRSAQREWREEALQRAARLRSERSGPGPAP